MTPRLRIALALSWRGVAILAVAGALAAVWLGLTDPDPSAPDSTARMGGQAAPGWVLPPPTAASDLADLLARPLFDPTRRPWQASGSAAAPVQAAPDWVLVATIVGTGRASAILRPAGGGVILKSQKGRDSYAFVDFQESGPAQVCGCGWWRGWWKRVEVAGGAWREVEALMEP